MARQAVPIADQRPGGGPLLKSSGFEASISTSPARDPAPAESSASSDASPFVALRISRRRPRPPRTSGLLTRGARSDLDVVADLAQLRPRALAHHSRSEGTAICIALETRMNGCPTRWTSPTTTRANTLIAKDPLALLIGFVLDQQVNAADRVFRPAQAPAAARSGSIRRRSPGLDPGRLEEIFREKPAIHRFPGNMARRVQELCADDRQRVRRRCGAGVWTDAKDDGDLRKRIGSLPGFGPMKITSLGAVLAKRFGVAVAEPLVPKHPTLGDVDSREQMERYQAAKREHKAKMRAEAH